MDALHSGTFRTHGKHLLEARDGRWEITAAEGRHCFGVHLACSFAEGLSGKRGHQAGQGKQPEQR
jgi:hypothetical protein